MSSSNSSNDLCLNADVLSTIFSFLTVNHRMDAGERLNARKALLAAAKSCKAFREPALNALWRVIPSFLPLLRLLPSLTKFHGLYILPDVQENDWHLYDTYSIRVREVIFEESRQAQVSPFIYTQLTRMRPPNNQSLLPRLKTIYLASRIRVDTALLLSLPGPQTECVVFDDDQADYPTHFLQAFLAILPQSPNLTHLSLSGPHILPLGIIPKLSRLRSLTLLMPHFQTFDFDFLKSLAALAHLAELTLHTGPPVSDAPANLVSGFMGSNHFGNKMAALRQLKLVGHPASVAGMLSIVLPMNVEKFIVDEEETRSDSSSTTASLEVIFALLSVLPHLQSIEVNQLSKRRWGNAGHALSMDLITPSLIKLCNPTEFHSLIINNGEVHASCASLKEFCSVFHRLRVFKLPFPPHITTLAFRSIYRHVFGQCPMLETLQMPVATGSRCRSFIQQGLSLVPFPTPHPLKRYFLPNSMVPQIMHFGFENAVLYAEFFDCVFPDLEALLLPDGSNQAWDDIEKTRLALQRARRRQATREKKQSM